MVVADVYISIGIFIIAAIVLPIVMLIIGWLFELRPSNPTPLKLLPFECGSIPIGGTPSRYGISYYMYGLLLVIFDVETVFLYPWAISFLKIGLTAMIEMFIFIGVLVLGLIYAWKKGALEWV
jgi:NADH-quinone oxidoreductase subunit A